MFQVFYLFCLLFFLISTCRWLFLMNSSTSSVTFIGSTTAPIVVLILKNNNRINKEIDFSWVKFVTAYLGLTISLNAVSVFHCLPMGVDIT